MMRRIVVEKNGGEKARMLMEEGRNVEADTNNKTATNMAATSGNGPLAPHMRPKWTGDNPPS
jgi:hypothetical protein